MTKLASTCAAASRAVAPRSATPHLTRVPRLLIVLAPLLAAAPPAPAWASLGGDVASVNADGAALGSPVTTTATVQYDRYQISHDGVVVHEYATRQGQIFAITWQGPFKPDLHQLLGGYFDRYQQAAAAQAHGGSHRALAAMRSDLVVQSVGRLRDFQGLAYVPSLLPAGVSVRELQ